MHMRASTGRRTDALRRNESKVQITNGLRLTRKPLILKAGVAGVYNPTQKRIRIR